LKDQKGSLYVIATPIGNLGDITFRAIETLKSVDLIAAEDTRHSKNLLTHYNVSTPLISYFEHNKFKRIPYLISHLNKGNHLGLISDAGTPGISDPAYKLIRQAIKDNITIISIPGASAFLTGLTASGLPTDRFIFEGFLPPKKGRKGRIAQVQNNNATLIYYESPKRLVRTLNNLFEVLGDRPAVVSRELTKKYEEIKRGTISELTTYFNGQTLRGEYIILIGKNDQNVFFT